MTEKLVAFFLRIGVAFLDKYLDEQIDRLKDENVRNTARRIEDEVVALLQGPLGKAIAQAIARPITVKALGRWFENREDTRTWG